MVLLEPPAPAARVLVGRALAIFSFWSAAARRRITLRAPPGGAGDDGRAVAAPAGGLTGEEARGEDCQNVRLVSFSDSCFFCFLLADGFSASIVGRLLSQMVCGG